MTHFHDNRFSTGSNCSGVGESSGTSDERSKFKNNIFEMEQYEFLSTFDGGKKGKCDKSTRVFFKHWLSLRGTRNAKECLNFI